MAALPVGAAPVLHAGCGLDELASISGHTFDVLQSSLGFEMVNGKNLTLCVCERALQRS